MRTDEQDSHDGPSIRLDFDDKTLRALRQAMLVRGMSGANAGLPEAFILRLLDQLDEGAESWHVKQKRRFD